MGEADEEGGVVPVEEVMILDFERGQLVRTGIVIGNYVLGLIWRAHKDDIDRALRRVHGHTKGSGGFQIIKTAQERACWLRGIVASAHEESVMQKGASGKDQTCLSPR